MIRQLSLTSLLLASVLSVAACGVETASTAASVATMKAEEARQAGNTKQQFENKLDAALANGQQRLKDGDQ